MRNQVITILGGSGFVGSYIAKELAPTGAYIKIASRNPEQALHLRTMGRVGQMCFQKLDIRDLNSIEEVVKNSDVIINLIGILNGSEKEFYYTHTTFPKILAQYAKKFNVKQLIHFSALGVAMAYDSVYANSKYEGEKVLAKEFPETIIVRPSVMFGPEDKFINKFTAIISLLPFFPLFQGGRAKLQPVYVGDVAKAIAAIVTADKSEYKGKVFEFAGNKVYSLKKIIEILEEGLNKNIINISIPWFLYVIFAYLCKLLPRPPVTPDQLKLLKYNNVMDKNSGWNLKSLGIKVSKLEEVIPHYINAWK